MSGSKGGHLFPLVDLVGPWRPGTIRVFLCTWYIFIGDTEDRWIPFLIRTIFAIVGLPCGVCPSRVSILSEKYHPLVLETLEKAFSFGLTRGGFFDLLTKELSERQDQGLWLIIIDILKNLITYFCIYIFISFFTVNMYRLSHLNIP